MLKEIKAAYNDYFEKYKRKPDYIVLNHQLFNDFMIESSEDSAPVFMGMRALVISDESSDFNLYEKRELDEALAQYEKDSPKIRSYTVARTKTNLVRRRDPNSNKPLELVSPFDLVEIDYKSVNAYRRHVEMKKQGQINNI